MLDRRQMLLATAGVVSLGAAATAAWHFAGGGPANGAESGDFEYTLSEAQWRARLSDAEFAVLRQEDTEPAFSSPLNDETRAGTFHCKGCELAVYASKTKFKSGTGWPSFYESLPDAVGTRDDNSLFMTRTEVHCRRCGGHFGHIFDDGPPPTGDRHCLNGIALTFEPANA